MSHIRKQLGNLLAVLPAILLLVFVNTFIAAALAGEVFLQLVAVVGWSKNLSLGVAILVAIVVHVYIMLQPKIRNYIKVRSLNE